MHRASAADNPQAPLAHHYHGLDARHARRGHGWRDGAGVDARGLVVQRTRAGREPDRSRSRPARLVLRAARLGARCVERAGIGRGAHHARGHRRRTTRSSCRRRSSYDADRIGRRRVDRGVRTEPRDSRQPRGVSARRTDAAHGRATRSTRVPNRSPRTFSMPASTRLAPSIGIASRRSARSRWATSAICGRRAMRRFGVGGDVTGYLVPDNSARAYGAPVSFHVFLRYRPRPGRPCRRHACALGSRGISSYAITRRKFIQGAAASAALIPARRARRAGGAGSRRCGCSGTAWPAAIR